MVHVKKSLKIKNKDVWLINVVGRIVLPHPPRCPCPNPWNLWRCYWQKGIKIVNQLTLRQRSILDDPGGSSVITKFFRCGKGRQKSQCQSQKRRCEDGSREPERRLPGGNSAWCCWLWRWRKGPRAKEWEQPLKAAEKGEGTDSSLDPPEGTRACPHLDFSPMRPTLNFLPTELWDNIFVLF